MRETSGRVIIAGGEKAFLFPYSALTMATEAGPALQSLSSTALLALAPGYVASETDVDSSPSEICWRVPTGLGAPRLL